MRLCIGAVGRDSGVRMIGFVRRVDATMGEMDDFAERSATERSGLLANLGESRERSCDGRAAFQSAWRCIVDKGKQVAKMRERIEQDEAGSESESLQGERAFGSCRGEAGW